MEFGQINFESSSDEELYTPDPTSSESESDDEASSEEIFLLTSSDSNPDSGSASDPDSGSDRDPATEFDADVVIDSHHQDLHMARGENQQREREEPMSTFKLCGDNIDKTVKRRYMRSDRGNISLHYFHIYATLDRVDVSSLSVSPLPTCLPSPENISESLLPSASDDIKIKKNFAVLVSRVMATHLKFFSFSFEDVIQWHIPHKFSAEMSMKSTVVS